jgi:transposase
VSGERDAVKLSSLADWRCKTPREVIAKSLEGTWNEDLLFALKQSYELYEFLGEQIRACEKKMEGLLEKYGCRLEAQANPQSQARQAARVEVLRSKKKVGKKTKVVFDVEQYGSQLFGVNLMRIPGISEGSLIKLIGELGHDFTENFESFRQFCRWENLAPDNRISGGKIISSRLPKRKNPAGQIFREAANGVKSSKTPLGDYYRRMKARKGPMGAVVATANKMSKIVYTMVKNKTEYNEDLIRLNEPQVLKKKLKNMQKQVARLQEQVAFYEKNTYLQTA